MEENKILTPKEQDAQKNDRIEYYANFLKRLIIAEQKKCAYFMKTTQFGESLNVEIVQEAISRIKREMLDAGWSRVHGEILSCGTRVQFVWENKD